MTDVTDVEITRRDIFLRISLVIFGLISRPKLGRGKNSFQRIALGWRKGKTERGGCRSRGCRFTRVYKL